MVGNGKREISKRKPLVINCILLLTASVLALEIIGFSLTSLASGKLIFLSHLTAVDGASLQLYDRELGWVEQNPRGDLKANPTVVLLGDSFTFGDELPKEHTWAHFLERDLRKKVSNEGVRGYGLDQSVLKLESVIKNSKTAKYVVLTVMQDNINRNQMVYWPFFEYRSTIYYTKPRFVLQPLSDKLELLKNPIRSKAELKRLKNQNELAKLGQNDFWYRQIQPPKSRFPYTRLFVSKGLWHQLSIIASGEPLYEVARVDLWEDAASVKLTKKILDRFVSSALKQGLVPIVHYLAWRNELRDYLRGQQRPSIKVMKQWCRQTPKTRCWFAHEELKGLNIEELSSYYQSRGHPSKKLGEMLGSWMSTKISRMEIEK